MYRRSGRQENYIIIKVGILAWNGDLLGKYGEEPEKHKKIMKSAMCMTI